MKFFRLFSDCRSTARQLAFIRSELGAIKEITMTTQTELAQGLEALQAQTDKARAEVLGKIADLEAALGNADSVSPEVQAAFDALKGSVQAVDDIVPDAPAEG